MSRIMDHDEFSGRRHRLQSAAGGTGPGLAPRNHAFHRIPIPLKTLGNNQHQPRAHEIRRSNGTVDQPKVAELQKLLLLAKARACTGGKNYPPDIRACAQMTTLPLPVGSKNPPFHAPVTTC